MRGPLLISLILGTPWLFVAERSAEGATVLIGFMASTAVVALLRSPAKDHWLLRAPVGLYAGWLTAATVVAFANTMAGHGLVAGSLGWAYAGIPLAVVLAVAVQLHKPKAPAYGLAVAWALFGIAVKNGGAYAGVTILAGLGLALVLGAALRGLQQEDTA